MPNVPGTKPLPGVLRQYQGSVAHRGMPLEIDAPLLENKEPPERLSETAQALWVEIVEALSEVSLLTNLDVVALEMLCEAYSDWCTYSAELANHIVTIVLRDANGAPILDANGAEQTRTFQSRFYYVVDQQGNRRPVLHPAATAMQDADRRLHSWLVEFGMTPSARAKWRSPNRDPLDETGGETPVDMSALSTDERSAMREILQRHGVTQP